MKKKLLITLGVGVAISFIVGYSIGVSITNQTSARLINSKEKTAMELLNEAKLRLRENITE